MVRMPLKSPASAENLGLSMFCSFGIKNVGLFPRNDCFLKSQKLGASECNGIETHNVVIKEVVLP